MRRFKGIIALDIDGTITVEKDRIEKKVEDFLNFLIADGWRLIFLTGRTFSFAYPILSGLKGEYHFAVQNGAALYEMPLARLVKKDYLPVSLLAQMPDNILIESGKENEDICYYRPAAFKHNDLEYIRLRISFSPEKWVSVDTFADLDITEFAAAKYFAQREKSYAFAERMRRLGRLNVTVIRDPFNPGNYLAFLNDAGASKGEILEEFRRLHPPGLPAIAAGDDLNDVEMLEKSTFKIVMRNAPEEMHRLADLVAPSAQEHGIIHGLKEATQFYGRND
ncbi:MAG: HAD family phosphatase [Chlamydiales bacterium]|nr:HAD family phosphatase [Chlamydiales bacterium]